MKLNYIKSQSSNKPDLVDTTSSKKYVYLRQNVVEKQAENMGKKVILIMSMTKQNLLKKNTNSI